MRPGERVGARLEDVGVELACLVGLERHAGDLEPAVLHRRGQVLDDRVEQAVRREVARRHAAGDGEQRAVVRALLERADDLLVRDLLALEVALHQRVGVLRDLVHQLLAVLLGQRPPARRGSGSRGSCRARRRRRRRPSCRRGRSRRETSCSAPIGISVATTCGPKAALSESSVRKKSARSRSSMFTKISRARSSSAARCHRRVVETSTPITALTTKIADSHTRSAPSASATKLGSPGVSSRLTLRSCHSNERQRRRDRHLARLLVGVGVGDRRALRHACRGG